MTANWYRAVISWWSRLLVHFEVPSHSQLIAIFSGHSRLLICFFPASPSAALSLIHLLVCYLILFPFTSVVMYPFNFPWCQNYTIHTCWQILSQYYPDELTLRMIMVGGKRKKVGRKSRGWWKGVRDADERGRWEKGWGWGGIRGGIEGRSTRKWIRWGREVRETGEGKVEWDDKAKKVTRKENGGENENKREWK